MILESLLAGGLTGLIGSVVSNVTDIFKVRQQNKFDLEKRKLDLQAMDKEYSFSLQMKEVDANMAANVADAGLMTASYAHDAATYSKGMATGWGIHALTLVDVIRGLVRPVLTSILLAVLWETRAEVKGVIDAIGMDALDPIKALNIYNSLVEAIIFVSTTSILWWFGTRLKGKK
jgi:hypothetical protein